MLTDREVEKYFKDNYEKKNKKRAKSVNAPQRLHMDFHKVCIDMRESMSKKICLFMTRIIMEHKKSLQSI